VPDVKEFAGPTEGEMVVLVEELVKP